MLFRSDPVGDNATQIFRRSSRSGCDVDGAAEDGSAQSCGDVGWFHGLRSFGFVVVDFGGLLKRGQFLFPLGGLGGFAPGVVELHQPFERFRDPVRGVEIRGQAGLALLEYLIALEQERSASA